MYVLTIRERRNSWAGRGPLTTLHATREKAEADLVSYVRDCWDDKMGFDPPEDDDELVDEYFDSVLEEYLISEAA